jgi:hypothetical protein
MAVAVQEVVAVLDETQRRLRVIAPDDPGRDALEASLSDLRLLYKWLTTETTATSATRLRASRQTIDMARQVLREQAPRRARRQGSCRTCTETYVVARRAMSEAARERAAYQAGLRTIRQGERPLYRVRTAADGSWVVDSCPWLSIDAQDRRSAVNGTRTAVAEWLGVDPEGFDVET